MQAELGANRCQGSVIGIFPLPHDRSGGVVVGEVFLVNSTGQMPRPICRPGSAPRDEKRHHQRMAHRGQDPSIDSTGRAPCAGEADERYSRWASEPSACGSASLIQPSPNSPHHHAGHRPTKSAVSPRYRLIRSDHLRNTVRHQSWRPRWNRLDRSRLDAGFGPRPARLEVPLDGPPQSLLEVGGGLEIEFALGARDIQAASRLTVGLARVPHDLAAKARQARNQADQVADCYLAAGPRLTGSAPL